MRLDFYWTAPGFRTIAPIGPQMVRVGQVADFLQSFYVFMISFTEIKRKINVFNSKSFYIIILHGDTLHNGVCESLSLFLNSLHSYSLCHVSMFLEQFIGLREQINSYTDHQYKELDYVAIANVTCSL